MTVDVLISTSRNKRGAGFFILFAGLIAFLTPGFPARTGMVGFRVGFLRWAIIVSLEGSGDSGE